MAIFGFLCPVVSIFEYIMKIHFCWWRWKHFFLNWQDCRHWFWSKRPFRHLLIFALKFWSNWYSNILQVRSLVLGPSWSETRSLVNSWQTSCWHWMCRSYHSVLRDRECQEKSQFLDTCQVSRHRVTRTRNVLSTLDDSRGRLPKFWTIYIGRNACH